MGDAAPGAYCATVVVNPGFGSRPLINTPLKRGAPARVRCLNRFSGFCLEPETAEAVPRGPGFAHTPLKRGVNEKPALARIHDAPADNYVFFIVVAYFVCALCTPVVSRAQTWQNALAQMPLHSQVRELNSTNCVRIMLEAFQSNATVKALVFMPGATDEFYLFRRARATLTNDHSTLLDAVAALTNQTFIRATLLPPFLLLHTTEDPLEPANTIQDRGTEEGLKRQARLEHLSCNDRDWDFLQPILKRSLKIALRPWRYSVNSWHFYRHSFVAWDVNGLEALKIAAFAGKSKFTLRRREAVFEVDPRVLAAPKIP
jgi:hypothetical protein